MVFVWEWRFECDFWLSSSNSPNIWYKEYIRRCGEYKWGFEWFLNILVTLFKIEVILITARLFDDQGVAFFGKTFLVLGKLFKIKITHFIKIKIQVTFLIGEYFSVIPTNFFRGRFSLSPQNFFEHRHFWRFWGRFFEDMVVFFD